MAAKTLPVTGNTPPVCAVGEPRLQSGNQINFRGLAGNTLQIDRMVDPTTLAVSAASVNVRFDAVCNYPHRLRIESQNNGLWPTLQRTQAPAPGFAYAVPYRATLTWGNVNGSLNADAQARRVADQRFNIDEATAGQIDLRLAVASGASNIRDNAPILAGDYTDTLRIFVEPR
ncbi:hypothetical protein ASE13_18760 [Sphingomonas sp. Root241]|nr:hypothetical protein ASE13_18760 [Sphingomonas sp. Root241]